MQFHVALLQLALIVRAADIKGQESVAAGASGLALGSRKGLRNGLSDEIDSRGSFLSMMLCTRTPKTGQ